MEETHIPQISVDVIVEKIMTEFERQKQPLVAEDCRLAEGSTSSQKAMEFNAKKYHLDEFLRYDGMEFIRNAYRGILKREADPEGLKGYLTQLMQGNIDKKSILESLRYSSEGRTKGIEIKGLFHQHLIHSVYKIPVVGFLIHLMITVFQLPKNIKTLGAKMEGLAGAKADIAELESIRKSILGQQEYKELLGNKADRVFVEELASKKVNYTEIQDLFCKKDELDAVQVMLTDKADRFEVENLSDLVNILSSSKADMEVVEWNLNIKADRSEVEKLSDQINKLDLSKAVIEAVEKTIDKKADRYELEDLSEQINQLVKSKAERADFEALTDKKADATTVYEMLGTKADRFDLLNLEDQKTEHDKLIGDLRKIIDQTHARITDISRKIEDQKRNILDQGRRLKLLIEEARKRLPDKMDNNQVEALVKENDHLLDAMYASFEDQFRGTRRDIQENAKVYLEYVQKVSSYDDNFILLDVGCGRGEWLELLKEQGFAAKGIDINRVMVDQCREYGLDVVEADAIDALVSLPPDSLSAVTAFHLIEHLSLDVLIRFLDETIRVLKSGGIAIFETPNPENISVSSCSFYLDPTHRHPLPSQMAQFLAEARGLCRLEIRYLHPYGEEYLLKGDQSELAERFEKLFYGPQDYALIGYKA